MTNIEAAAGAEDGFKKWLSITVGCLAAQASGRPTFAQLQRAFQQVQAEQAKVYGEVPRDVGALSGVTETSRN